MACQGTLTLAPLSSMLDTMDNVVKERRAQLGLSQAQLAGAMGVSRQTINSIETGRYLPSLPLAIALARFFSTSVEEIFNVDA